MKPEGCGRKTGGNGWRRAGALTERVGKGGVYDWKHRVRSAGQSSKRIAR
jgi:hypothetical protein